MATEREQATRIPSIWWRTRRPCCSAARSPRASGSRRLDRSPICSWMPSRRRTPLALRTLAEHFQLDAFPRSAGRWPCCRQEAGRSAVPTRPMAGSACWRSPHSARPSCRPPEAARHAFFAELLADWSEDDRQALGTALQRLNQAIARRDSGTRVARCAGLPLSQAAGDPAPRAFRPSTAARREKGGCTQRRVQRSACLLAGGRAGSTANRARTSSRFYSMEEVTMLVKDVMTSDVQPIRADAPLGRGQLTCWSTARGWRPRGL